MALGPLRPRSAFGNDQLVGDARAAEAALAPGGRLVLAGLLDRQAEAVAGAYRRKGMMLVESVSRGEWPTLLMRRRQLVGRRG